MTKRILSKASWKDAIGATKKPKRLKFLSHNRLFICPVAYCESEPYRIKRGCHKHVFTKQGWHYYLEEKPDIAWIVFPEFATPTNNYQLPKPVKTSNRPTFLRTCVVGVNFKKWLQSHGGWGKGESEADELLLQILKVFEVLLCICLYIVRYSWENGRLLLRICHNDFWFCGILTIDWSLKSSGVTGYMNALGHLFDFCRSYRDLTQINSSTFIPSEIHIQRVKRYLPKKMKSNWR